MVLLPNVTPVWRLAETDVRWLFRTSIRIGTYVSAEYFDYTPFPLSPPPIAAYHLRVMDLNPA